MPKTRIAIVALTLFLAVAASAQAEIKRGDAGPNTFSGTPHRDWYWGYGGDDTLFGRAATDYLYGGGDNDTIVAGRGADFAYGGDGADEIALRRGNDFAWGGAGADRISTGLGADTVKGGPGNDTIYATADDGAVDSIDCGTGTDHALIRAGDTTLNCETVDTVT